MNEYMTIFLIAFEIVIVAGLYLLYKKTISLSKVPSIDEVFSERTLIERAKKEILEKFEENKKLSDDMSKKLQILASEIEVDVEEKKKSLRESLKEIIDEEAMELEPKLALMKQEYQQIEKLMGRVEKEKFALSKALERSEMTIKLLDNKTPFEKVLSELNRIKYADAKKLLAKGYTPQDVAFQLNIPLSEVQQLRGMAAI